MLGLSGCVQPLLPSQPARRFSGYLQVRLQLGIDRGGTQSRRALAAHLLLLIHHPPSYHQVICTLFGVGQPDPERTCVLRAPAPLLRFRRRCEYLYGGTSDIGRQNPFLSKVRKHGIVPFC